MSQDKRTALYEAALSMIEEKHDMSSIKVADIAQKANIGKGTVYEYFESKEQLIAEAIIHMVKQGIQALEKVADSPSGFKESYRLILEHMEEMMSRNKTFFKYFTLNECNFSMHKTIQTIVEQQFEEIRSIYVGLFERIVEKGIREGILKGKPSVMDGYIAYSNSMMCLLLYKQGFKELEYLNRDEVMEKSYEVFVKLLL